MTECGSDFLRRHLGPSEFDAAVMFETVGVQDIGQLINEVVPAGIRFEGALAVPPAVSESRALAELREIADLNDVRVNLIGQGYHGTILPAVIRRNVLENPAWYTAYTPYQPEISQGRLEALLNFQTMVADLTALDVANASLLDEATAAAEAMAMAARAAPSHPRCFFVDRACHPQTIAVLRTRAAPLGWTIRIGDPASDLDPAAVFGAIFQYPGTHGSIDDRRTICSDLTAVGAVPVMAVDILAMTLLTPPGELGADIAVGSAQRFGTPLGYGGPHAGFIACRERLKRMLPGRLVGVSVDAHGRTAHRLALQAREQHIRRERATSNICTAQALLAIVASMYAVHHGPEGLRAIAERINRHAVVLAAGLRKLGFSPTHEAFFDTLSYSLVSGADAIVARGAGLGLNFRLGRVGGTGAVSISIALDETTTEAIVETIWAAFGGRELRYRDFSAPTESALPEQLRRTTNFLTHPVFHAYRSETALMRYMRRLADKDLALDRAMIPLGSCTMKLNAAAEMEPISWPQFSNLHPYAPREQARGYERLVADLERQLCEITGYDAASFQPNSGAQGEYAGLLAIRRWHESLHDADRDICLIPSSAHGTNPASAQMVGWRVVVVRCDSDGNVDIADFANKAREAGNRLAAAMITYPSTHGVFEEGIRELCDLVHAEGGQVYLDGANLNAMVGLSRPGDLGADISHFNLHKTFCVPHGGGGPGVGPIAVKTHLSPFLPGDPLDSESGCVAAARFGSAGILPISWMYLRMMGPDGLVAATRMAILSANYLATRLSRNFPLLYTGENGRVAHECIVDLREIQDATGITVEDVAKRLMDFGFHPPTMSFPVAGTLMIEPTESEDLRELDRFADAMAMIRLEIDAVAVGEIQLADSPLRHAPHTMRDITDDSWDRPYSRREGCFPAGSLEDKYWPAVSRVDNVFGDRNLVCSCPPIATYEIAGE